MASYTVNRTKHKTLVANTADSLTIPSDGDLSQIWLSNRSSSGLLWYTTDGTTPVAAADDTDFVFPYQTVTETVGPGTVVKVICATANDYSLKAL